MSEPTHFEVYTVADLMRMAAERKQLDVDVGPKDPRHSTMIEVSDGYVTVYWGKYAYHIERERARTPEQILDWVEHLAAKTWEHTTPKRIVALIRVLKRQSPD